MVTRWNMLAAAALVFWAGAAGAQVQFDRKFIPINATLDQTQAVAEFAFVNTGDKPVRIVSAEADCDCTAAKADKDSYAPGEKGKITVTFDFGQRVGAQEKNITVTTDDGIKTLLRLVVHIPELLNVSPRLVYWPADAARSPKTITLIVAEGVTMKITKIEADSAAVSVELKTIEDGRKYEVVVTPGQNVKPGTITLTIHADGPGGKPRTFTAYAKVMAK